VATVDVHNHVMPTEALDLLNAEPSYGVTISPEGEWQGVHHVPFTVVDSFRDPEAKLAQMDALGIDVAIESVPPPLFFYEVSPAEGERLCEATNEGLARFCERSPERLHWLANLPMQDPDLAVTAYRRALADGCIGAALGTSIAGRRLDHPEFSEFWATAEQAGRPVLLHPAFNEKHEALSDWYLQNVIGNPLETTVVVERLLCAGVLADHPGLRLVLLHGGGYIPYQIGRLRHARTVRPELAQTPADLLAPFGQLFFDTITHDLEALRFLVRRVGADHVVLGTDLPFDMALQTPMETLRQALADDELRRVTQQTPADLFGLAGDTGGRPVA
jgi:aminocarboxymuconate-semialdehyde decarboxylase